MTFAIGNRVKWKEATPIRLGYTPFDIGEVIGIGEDAGEPGAIDVEFDNGDILHGAEGDWFEPVEDAAMQNEEAID
ncbi:MAG: hypothetical protein WBX25_24725 [Rhodomicrobium sp.]